MRWMDVEAGDVLEKTNLWLVLEAERRGDFLEAAVLNLLDGEVRSGSWPLDRETPYAVLKREGG